MDTAAGISLAIRHGQDFFRHVMALDPGKHLHSVADLEAALNGHVQDFAGAAGLRVAPRIAFGDIHAKMGRKWHTELAYVEVKGSDCRLYFDHSLIASANPHAGLVFVAKSWVLLWVLDHALASNPGLDTAFVFEIGDNASLGEVGFSSSHPAACLILDYDFAASGGYASYREICDFQRVPWAVRARKIFWRGSTTGQRSSPPPAAEPDDLRWLPRLALCGRCRQPDIRELCDVGITQIQQIPEPALRARILTADFLREPVPREEFMRYRGAFDIDGNCNAWSGLFCSLLGASCILKIASPGGYRQWYYDRLKPWDNYIPVQSDLRDIQAAVHWFATHDAEAEVMAGRGRELALSIDLESALAESADNLLQWVAGRAR